MADAPGHLYARMFLKLRLFPKVPLGARSEIENKWPVSDDKMICALALRQSQSAGL